MTHQKSPTKRAVHGEAQRRSCLDGTFRRDVALFCVLFLTVGSIPGCGEPTSVELASREPPDAAQRGAELFAEHCVDCHGRDGRGNGPLARGLVFVPADLTRIAARRGGQFAREEIRRAIDGRAEQGGHRRSEMPRWAEFWEAHETADVVAQNIAALVVYLESIQRLDTAEDLSTPERMDRLATALEQALPVVFSDAAVGDPVSLRAFETAAELLGANAAELEAHSGHATFAPLARSMVRDAERASAAYRAGQLRRARFRVGELLENCVACHARLPSPGDSDIGARLVKSVDTDALHPNEELRLLLATRRFETARERYETLLGQAGEGGFERWGLLTDYLIVSIRVFDDVDRPRRTLEQLATHRDTGAARAAELRSWKTSLEEVSRVEGADPFSRAQALLRKGQDLRRNAGPGAGLVFDIAASGQLFRLIESEPEDLETLADAYYLLGVTESRIGRPAGRERWDDYLDAAIRLAPNTATSRAAFALYEEQRLQQIRGLSLFALPRAELHRVEELRALAFGPSET